MPSRLPKSQAKKPEAAQPDASSGPTLASVFAPPKRKVVPEVSREDLVRQAVKSCPALDEDAIDYLANMAVSLVEDFNDAPALKRELEEGFLPMLEEYEVSTEDAQALCAKVLQAAAPANGANGANGDEVSVSGAVDESFLCYVPNLLLMYGGSPEPLLRGACLEIRRGHRYGVVGSNGSGKTTLMARIASKDISGLPEDLRVVLLRHEAILQGVRRSTKVRDYVSQRNVGDDAATDEEMEKALQIMGFETEEQMGKAVLELSGGWQMRLALACAVARKANLLLLDEPTNHLDAEGVRWLVEFINTTCGDGQGAALIVSHDPDFLDLVCTDVVHFSPSTQKGKLAYYPGIFSAFKQNQLKGDEVEAKRLLETEEQKEAPSLGLGPNDGNRMAFPIPEKIGDTMAERRAPVVTLEKAAFRYKGAEEPVFQDLSVELSMSSRVGIVGKNGSGKSTLLSMLAGRKQPTSIDGKTGRLWWHKDLRLAYIAQHALVHLGNYVDKTPLEYMQIRFRRGFDEETPIVRGEKLLSAKEEEEMQKVGIRHGKRGKGVESLVNRIEITDRDKAKEKDREFLYEVKWKDLSPAENTFESYSRLKQLKALKLVEDLNSRIWAAWAGCPQRPLTDREVLQHMEPFGLDEDVLCHRKISVLSSGQKCKLALGAAFWTRPHVICLDEPTNYLDTDTVELLKRALRGFRGGFAVVSHSEKLIEEACDDVWTMEDGRVSIERRRTK